MSATDTSGLRSRLGARGLAALLACACLAACARAVLEAPRAAVASRVQVVVPERAAEEPRQPPLTPDEEALNRVPLKLPLSNPRVVVRKGARRLELFEGGERVRVFRAGLGFAPEGDKERQGDGRTPEGEFYVCMKNGRSSFHVSLGLSYPAADDAERALRDGLITRAQRDLIVRANRKRLCPPWDTRLGGEIFIHGGGTGSDWTFGCVALENEHVEELFNHVPTGTNVRIEP